MYCVCVREIVVQSQTCREMHEASCERVHEQQMKRVRQLVETVWPAKGRLRPRFGVRVVPPWEQVVSSALDFLHVLLALDTLPADADTVGSATLLEGMADDTVALALVLGLGLRTVKFLFKNGLGLTLFELGGEVSRNSVMGGRVGATTRVGQVVGTVLNLVA